MLPLTAMPDIGSSSSSSEFAAQGRGRLLVWAVGHHSSGIPEEWAAGPGQPGVALTELTGGGAERITARVRAAKRPGDVVVVSIHWGSNWGFEVPSEQRRFAHALIDGGERVCFGRGRARVLTGLLCPPAVLRLWSACGEGWYSQRPQPSCPVLPVCGSVVISLSNNGGHAPLLCLPAGVDVVHGHSSHHLKGAELYRGRLVAYGCGDLISDYEGIRVGHREGMQGLPLLHYIALAREHDRWKFVMQPLKELPPRCMMVPPSPLPPWR